MLAGRSLGLIGDLNPLFAQFTKKPFALSSHPHSGGQFNEGPTPHPNHNRDTKMRFVHTVFIIWRGPGWQWNASLLGDWWAKNTRLLHHHKWGTSINSCYIFSNIIQQDSRRYNPVNNLTCLTHLTVFHHTIRKANNLHFQSRSMTKCFPRDTHCHFSRTLHCKALRL